MNKDTHEDNQMGSLEAKKKQNLREDSQQDRHEDNPIVRLDNNQQNKPQDIHKEIYKDWIEDES